MVIFQNGKDIVKAKKDEISNLVKSLKTLTIYNSTEEIIKSIKSTEDYAKIIIDILLEFDKKIKEELRCLRTIAKCKTFRKLLL